MENIKITQEHIEKYVAKTEDFWKEFHQSLSAPFHPWNDFKNQSLKQWINSCRKDNGMLPYLNLLFEYPVLKGEYLIAYSQAMLLTNYRLIMNDSSTGVNNIPLKNLEFYGEKEFGEKWIDKVTKDVIEYLRNGSKLTLEWTSLREDIVNSAKTRNLSETFEKEQQFILENSIFELKRLNPELEVPKIEIPEQQDTSINLKQSIEALTQEQANKYIADTENFWQDFHKSLGNSFSFWNQHKDVTFQKWVSMCWNTKEMIEHFNILFQYPLLKGEFPIAYAAGMILTNYRLLINDKSNNVASIPLTKIKKYSLQEGGIIEIEDQTEKLQYNELLKEEFVTSAISRCKKEGLDKMQEKLITNSLVELNKYFSTVSIPKTEMYPLTEEQKIEKQKVEKAEKSGNVVSKIIGFVVIAAIVFGAIMLFGNSSPEGKYCSATQGCEWYVELSESGSCTIHNPAFGGVHRTGTYRIDGKSVYMTFNDGNPNVTAKLDGSKLIVGSTVYKK